MKTNLRHDPDCQAHLIFGKKYRRIAMNLEPEATADARSGFEFGCKVGYAIFAASLVVALIFFLIGLMFVPTIFLIFVSFIIWYVGGLIVAAMNLVGMAFSIVGLAFSVRSRSAFLGNLGSLVLNGAVVCVAGYLYRHLFLG